MIKNKGITSQGDEALNSYCLSERMRCRKSPCRDSRTGASWFLVPDSRKDHGREPRATTAVQTVRTAIYIAASRIDIFLVTAV